MCAIAATAWGAHAQPASANAPAAVSTIPDARLADIRAQIEQGRAALGVPGLAVAVVDRERILLLEGFGSTTIGGTSPVTPDTRFGLASTSKAFTAMAAAILADEGRLSLDAPVRTWLPGLRLPRAGAADTITLRHMLAHRTGFARHDFMWHARPDMSRTDFVRALADLPMPGDPGRDHDYTNSGFILAGAAIDMAVGQTWEEVVRTRILAPLGMQRTGFDGRALADDPLAAKPHRRREGASRPIAVRDTRLLGPAGSLDSSARDLVAWMQLHLNRGTSQGRQLVSPARFAELWAPQVVLPAPAGSTSAPAGYGLGWRIDSWRGHYRVFHGGAIDGYRARVTLYPDAGYAIAVLANVGPSLSPDLVTTLIAERLLGLAPTPDLLGGAARRLGAGETAEADGLPASRLTRLADHGVPEPISAHPLADYAGLYEHPAYGPITITAAGERLGIVFGAVAGVLEPWTGEGFVGRSPAPDDTLDGVQFVFRRDFDGRLVALEALIEDDVAPVAFTRRADASWAGPAVVRDWPGLYAPRGRPQLGWRIEARDGVLHVLPPGAATAAALGADRQPGWLAWGPAEAPEGRLRVRARTLEVIDGEGLLRLPRAGGPTPAPGR